MTKINECLQIAYTNTWVSLSVLLIFFFYCFWTSPFELRIRFDSKDSSQFQCLFASNSSFPFGQLFIRFLESKSFLNVFALYESMYIYESFRLSISEQENILKQLIVTYTISDLSHYVFTRVHTISDRNKQNYGKSMRKKSRH